MSEFNISVGKRIRKLREEYGYTREKLAESAGMNDKFLYEVEVGRKGLSAQKMFQLAEALSTSMDHLAAGKKESDKCGRIAALLKTFSESEMRDVEDIIRKIVKIANK